MIIVNIFGLVVVALIIWWFWLYKPNKTSAKNNEIHIEVKDGVYSPSSIQVDAEKPVILSFLRKDPSPCAETVLFPSLDVSQQLRINEVTQVTLSKLPPGEHEFHCQMNMYRGILKAE